MRNRLAEFESDGLTRHKTGTDLTYKNLISSTDVSHIEARFRYSETLILRQQSHTSD